MNVYISSGWFNEKQREDLEIIKQALSMTNVKYFSPKDELPCAPSASDKVKERIFNSNLVAIKSCDVMICNTRDKDMGSIFEAGFAYALGKPIIYFCRGLTRNFNLMLAQSGRTVSANASELYSAIMLIKNDPKWSNKYKGRIE